LFKNSNYENSIRIVPDLALCLLHREKKDYERDKAVIAGRGAAKKCLSLFHYYAPYDMRLHSCKISQLGIGITAFLMSVWYRSIPGSDWVRHRHFFTFQYRTHQMPDSPPFYTFL
jgi:hypothetical protein